MASLFPLSWTGWVSILSAAVAVGQASSLPVRSVDDIGRLEACPTAEEQAKTVAPLRIITLGDSITKGVRPGVAAAETFGALIEAELRKTARRLEVVNSGVGSERTDGALLRRSCRTGRLDARQLLLVARRCDEYLPGDGATCEFLSTAPH